MGEETCYTNIQRFFTRLRKVIKLVFLTLVVALGQILCLLPWRKHLCFYHILLKGMEISLYQSRLRLAVFLMRKNSSFWFKQSLIKTKKLWLFFYNKIGSIILKVVLPPTEIIEPLINELLLIFFLEGVFYFCFYIWHLKAILIFRIALRCFLCDFQFVFRSGGAKNK